MRENLHSSETLLNGRARRGASGQGGRARILFVDDEPRIAVALQRLLRREWELVPAGTAEAALERLRQEPIDIVIADHYMQPHSGVWLLEQVQRLQPHVLRVLVSGGEPPRVQHYRDQGLLHAFLPKPLTWDGFVACCRALL